MKLLHRPDFSAAIRPTSSRQEAPPRAAAGIVAASAVWPHRCDGCPRRRPDPLDTALENDMKTSVQLTTALCLASLLVGASQADAKDAVQAGVSIPAGEATPLMAENGNGYTPGTYAVGSIILNYTFVGTSFPAGLFSSFDLNLKVYDVSTKNDPSYPVSLNLEDIGAKHLSLVSMQSPLNMTGTGWTQTDRIAIVIPSEVATDPEFAADGSQLVGHLRLTTPGGSGVDTATDVVVKITLVHPAGPCIRLYNFITDTSYATTSTSTEVNVNSRGKVTSTNPFGSLSSNALVVNTCATDVTFDIRMALDGSFSTQPANTAGHAVRTFSTAEELDPSSFDIAAFGDGTPMGQQLCLQSVTVPAGHTFLDAVHVAINNGVPATGLPADATFDFSATLYLPGAACTGSLLPEAGAASATVALPFTTK
jgi:hypothetical protein